MLSTVQEQLFTDGMSAKTCSKHFTTRAMRGERKGRRREEEEGGRREEDDEEE